MATPTTLPATFVAGNVLTAAQMNDLRGAFRVLQVVSTTKTDTFTTTSTTFTDITGLTATITPSATSNRILVFAAVNGCNDVGAASMALCISRGGTQIFLGDAAGSRSRGSEINNWIPQVMSGQSLITLDNPASTSAITYAIQVRSVGAGTSHINRSETDTDSATFLRAASSITVMEISL
jgi:hypothetical protein